MPARHKNSGVFSKPARLTSRAVPFGKVSRRWLLASDA